MLHYAFSKHAFWVSLYFYPKKRLVLSLKHNDNKPLFSEREGYKKYYKLPFFPWRVTITKGK